MMNLHYTPEEMSRFTLPQFLCLICKKPPTEKKLESMSEFSKILEEDARKEQEWLNN